MLERRSSATTTRPPSESEDVRGHLEKEILFRTVTSTVWELKLHFHLMYSELLVPGTTFQGTESFLQAADSTVKIRELSPLMF